MHRSLVWNAPRQTGQLPDPVPYSLASLTCSCHREKWAPMPRQATTLPQIEHVAVTPSDSYGDRAVLMALRKLRQALGCRLTKDTQASTLVLGGGKLLSCGVTA